MFEKIANNPLFTFYANLMKSKLVYIELKSNVTPLILSDLIWLIRYCCTILRFSSPGCLNDHIDLHNKIGSSASGATAFLVSKNWTKKISYTMDVTITYRQTLVFEVSKWLSSHGYSQRAKLSRFGFADLPKTPILDFQMSVSNLFDDIQG